MEPVYKKIWYAPWLSDKFSCDLFLTCQLQSVVHSMKPRKGIIFFFLLYKYTNWLSRRLVTCQPVSAQGTLLPTCLITHAKIWNELLIPFFSIHAKGKKRARYFKCLLKLDFSGIMLGINLPSCGQSFFPNPLANSGLFPIHSKFLSCSSMFRESLNVGWGSCDWVWLFLFRTK